MTAEVYRESTESDDAGQISREWFLWKTVECYAHSIEATGRSFGSQETWDRQYDYEDIVKFRTSEDILLSDQITKIKDINGRILWTNDDGTPTYFNVSGIAPRSSPFGEFVGYDIMLKRSEIQYE